MGHQTRNEEIRKLGEEQFDIVIIGGGITGAGIFRDAALRGLKVALVERSDFAEGTSSRSSKLVHGGLRYLEQKNFVLVHEGTTERGRLLKLAKPLVRPLPFILPVYRDSRHSLNYISLGMWLYDILGMFSNYKNHRRLNSSQLQRLESSIKSNDLVGGILYYDALTDDYRLTIENIIGGIRAGGIAISRIEAESASFRDGRISAISLRDLVSNSSIEVKTKLVISAAGPWTEEVMNRMQAAQSSPRLRPTKGVHIVLPFEVLPIKHAIVLTGPRDGRAMFTIPWHGATIVGTTDTDFAGPLHKVQADKNDVDYLLEAVAYMFPDVKISRKDIVGTWAGVRPLINTEGVKESEVSREHLITTDPRGIIAIAGGKLTTYRLMAKATLARAYKILKSDRQVGSQTHRMPLPCTPGADQELEMLFERALRVGLSSATATHLIESYGVRANEVLDIASSDPSLFEPIHPSLPFIKAQIVHAVRMEMAMTLIDVWCRRLPIFYLLRDQGLGCAEEASRLMAKELSWDEAKRNEAIRSLTELANAHMACISE